MAIVGGRVEAVVPRRSLFGTDYVLLAVLAAAAAGVHLWLVTHTVMTARDSIGFARYALAIQSPTSTYLPWEGPPADIPPGRDVNSLDVIRKAQHPPGYPLAVWLTGKVVRKLWPGPDPSLPDAYVLAAQIASSLAAVLLVIPVYLTGRMLFGRFAGFAAVLLFQVLPVPARITSDGLSEGLYLLAAAVAVALAVRAVRRPGVGGFLLCGLATGATYLVRPEGLLVGAAVVAVSGWLGLTRRWPRDLTLGRLTALAVGAAFVAVPYMAMIGKLTNKPSSEILLNPGATPQGKWMPQGGPATGAVAATGGPLFAEWQSTPGEGVPARAVWGAEAVVRETVKSLHYLPAALALLGLVAFRRRIAADPGLLVLLALAALNAALLCVLAVRVNYVSERHTMLLTVIACVFAGAALEPVTGWLAALPGVGRFWAGKLAPVGLLLALVATALPPALKPLHANREGHKHAGRWLADKVKDGDCLIDPFEWAQWYAWRSLYFVPKDPPADPPPEITYAVVDDKERTNDHTRLPRMEAAKNVAADGRAVVVYHWPEDVPAEAAKVKVYKLVRKAGN